MASLEFKQRVKLPEEFFLDRAPGRPRRWPRWPLALLLWAGFSGLCFGINTGSVPLTAWLDAALGEPPPEPVAALERTATAAAAPTAAAPAILMGTAPADLGPIPSEPEPAAEALAVGSAAALVPSADHSAHNAWMNAAQPETPDLSTAQTPAPQTPAPQLVEPAAPGPKPDLAASWSSAGMSCEAAIANYQEEIRIGGPSAPADLSRSQYAAVLEDGSYFSHCGVPDQMSVEICVAVRAGKVLGVSVGTDPGNAAVQRCVGRAVRGLSFPSHPRMDVTRTRFAAN